MTSLTPLTNHLILNPMALRKAKIVYNFGLSERKRVNDINKWSGKIVELSHSRLTGFDALLFDRVVHVKFTIIL